MDFLDALSSFFTGAADSESDTDSGSDCSQRRASRWPFLNLGIDVPPEALPTVLRAAEEEPLEGGAGEGEEADFVSMRRMRWSLWRLTLFALVSLLSGGLLPLAASQFPAILAYGTKRTCREDEPCSSVLLLSQSGRYSEHPIRTRAWQSSKEMGLVAAKERERVSYFSYQFKRFSKVAEDRFARMRYVVERPLGILVSEVGRGLSLEQARRRALLFGPNELRAHVPGVLVSFVSKLFRPMFLFQAFTFSVWIAEEYYPYGSFVIALTFASLLWELYVERTQAARLDRRLVQKARSPRPLRAPRCLAEGGAGRGAGERGGGAGRAEVRVPSVRLVPGDVLLLDRPGPILADLVLLSGPDCLVDESNLRGVAMPISKQPLAPVAAAAPGVRFEPAEHASHVLLSGTQLLQISPAGEGGEGRVRALVFRTGFQTEKGSFFHRILFPRRPGRNILADMYQYYSLMLCMAVVTFFIALSNYTRNAEGPLSASALFLSCADIATIAIPPALFLLQGLVVIVGRVRLERLGCQVGDPYRISAAGQCDTMCLDKTGCLTSEKLEFAGAQPALRGAFREVMAQFLPGSAPELQRCLAASHGLLPGQEAQGINAVDSETFSGSGFTLVQPDRSKERQRHALAIAKPPASVQGPDDDGEELVLLRRFDFDARLRCASVLAMGIRTASLRSFAKGAPEAIRPLCLPHTVPANFDKVLHAHQAAGLFVLACASRTLPFLSPPEVLAFPRREAESHLEFCGFVLLRNPVKPQASALMASLGQAAVRPVVVTGDSLLTAVAVSRGCGHLAPDARVFVVDLDPASVEGRRAVAAGEKRDEEADEVEVLVYNASDPSRLLDLRDTLDEEEGAPSAFAVSGSALAFMRRRVALAQRLAEEALAADDEGALEAWDEAEALRHLFLRLLERAALFARVTPEEKGRLVHDLEHELGHRVAVVGDGLNDCAALREATVGVAVANTEASTVASFTSVKRNLLGCGDVIRQGRCTLSCSYTLFKFMAVCNCMQLMWALRLNYISQQFSATQYLWHNLGIVFPNAITISLSPPLRRLTPNRPRSYLVNLVVTAVCQLAIAGAAFGAVQHLVAERFPAPPGTLGAPQLASAAWLVGNVQFFAAAFAVYSYRPDEQFREPLYKNPVYVVFSLAHFGVSSWLLLADAPGLGELFGLVPLGDDQLFRLLLWGIGAAQTVAAMAVERYVVGPLTPRLRDAARAAGRALRSAAESLQRRWIARRWRRSRAGPPPRRPAPRGRASPSASPWPPPPPSPPTSRPGRPAALPPRHPLGPAARPAAAAAAAAAAARSRSRSLRRNASTGAGRGAARGARALARTNTQSSAQTGASAEAAAAERPRVGFGARGASIRRTRSLAGRTVSQASGAASLGGGPTDEDFTETDATWI
eukprot:tig00000237_g20471.t1